MEVDAADGAVVFFESVDDGSDSIIPSVDDDVWNVVNGWMYVPKWTYKLQKDTGERMPMMERWTALTQRKHYTMEIDS